MVSSTIYSVYAVAALVLCMVTMRHLSSQLDLILSGSEGVSDSGSSVNLRRNLDFEKNSRKYSTIAYALFLSSREEVFGTLRFLNHAYDPNNFYVIHVDAKAEASVVQMAEHLVDDLLKRKREAYVQGDDNDSKNVIFLQNRVTITMGYSSLLGTAFYSMAISLKHWNTFKWDYWINISPSTMPLLPQKDIMMLLGEANLNRLSFIDGFEVDWNSIPEISDRRRMFYDDYGMYQNQDTPHQVPAEKNSYSHLRIDTVGKRIIPTAFEVYKNSFWVMLHRDMVEYILLSPDNVARQLWSYFSSSSIPDETFFGTLACHPQRNLELPIVSVAAQYESWNSGGSHADLLDEEMVDDAIRSDKLFARKFPAALDGVLKSTSKLSKYLEDDDVMSERLKRCRITLQLKYPDEYERPRFCASKKK